MISLIGQIQRVVTRLPSDRFRLLAWATIALAGYNVPGCVNGFPFSLTAIDDVPGDVQAVAAQKDFFRQDADHPLMHVEPGTVIDELGGLDGCWGGFIEAQPDEGYYGDDAESVRFDFAEGTLTRQMYRVNVMSILGFAPPSGGFLVSEYTIEAVESDRIRVKLRRQEGALPILEDGGDEPATIVAPEDEFPDLSSLELRITRDGDRFVIADALDAPNYIAGIRLFRRFDCPDSVEPDSQVAQ